MHWGGGKAPLLSAEQEEWQLVCWQWMIEAFSTARPLRDTALVLPTVDFFPATDEAGHGCALHLFRHTAGLMSVEPDAFDLIAHNDFPDNMRRGAPRGEYAAGTFSFTSGDRMQISYHPSLLERPLDLIGIFSHEIAHGLFATVDRPPPGGWEMEEFAVELMTVYFGFGLFGANKAFQVSGETGFLSWFRGVNIATSGYISQEQWAFALAVFLTLRGDDEALAREWLGPVLKKMLTRGLYDLAANPDKLARLSA